MSEHYVGDFPLILRRHPRARHLKLRYEARSESAVLTLPPGISDRKALQFANRHHDWICDQYEKSPPPVPLHAGETIPFRGQLVKIIHRPSAPAGVNVKDNILMVGGSLAGLEVRLLNWFKKQARAIVNEVVEDFAPRLNLHPHRVMVRDTKSRWGSCSSRKTLSFSWRLILAPPEILRYVVAHEVAHLGEMNHGPEFWKLVESLYPDWRKSRRWLKTEGNGLMMIG